MQEKWARPLGVLIRCGGRGVAAGPVSDRGLERNKRGGVAGGQKIITHAISASQARSSHRVSLANISLQRVRYIATIRHTIPHTVMPVSMPAHTETTLDLSIYVRGGVEEVFI